MLFSSKSNTVEAKINGETETQNRGETTWCWPKRNDWLKLSTYRLYRFLAGHSNSSEAWRTMFRILSFPFGVVRCDDLFSSFELWIRPHDWISDCWWLWLEKWKLKFGALKLLASSLVGSYQGVNNVSGVWWSCGWARLLVWGLIFVYLNALYCYRLIEWTSQNNLFWHTTTTISLSYLQWYCRSLILVLYITIFKILHAVARLHMRCHQHQLTPAQSNTSDPTSQEAFDFLLLRWLHENQLGIHSDHSIPLFSCISKQDLS